MNTMETVWELIGAFAFWMFSGFKGNYQDYLREEAGYRSMWLGLVIFFAGVFVMILMVRQVY